MSVRHETSVAPLSLGLENDIQPGCDTPVGVPPPDEALHRRRVHVSISSSISDLCRQRSSATWAPSAAALETMLQQQKFVDLSGKSDYFGDLQSVVLHKLAIDNVRSTFPVSVGANITGVDPNTFTKSGNAFGVVFAPNSVSDTPRSLQEDRTQVTYEFAGKFPGYTAKNLDVRGVHEVGAKNFTLVETTHPVCMAVAENADRLQVGELAIMPEGLVKMDNTLYQHVKDMVQTQVAAQVKVRDFSSAKVEIAPADHTSWSAARDHLVVVKKAALEREKAIRVRGANGNADDIARIEASFNEKLQLAEHEIDSMPIALNFDIDMKYNFLSDTSSSDASSC